MRFHINEKTNRTGKCNAKTADACPLKSDDGGAAEHFDTKEAAESANYERLAKKHTVNKTLTKGNAKADDNTIASFDQVNEFLLRDENYRHDDRNISKQVTDPNSPETARAKASLNALAKITKRNAKLGHITKTQQDGILNTIGSANFWVDKTKDDDTKTPEEKKAFVEKRVAKVFNNVQKKDILKLESAEDTKSRIQEDRELQAKRELNRKKNQDRLNALNSKSYNKQEVFNIIKDIGSRGQGNPAANFANILKSSEETVYPSMAFAKPYTVRNPIQTEHGVIKLQNSSPNRYDFTMNNKPYSLSNETGQWALK